MIRENDRREYAPVEGEDALQVDGFDARALDFVIDYLRGRAGMEPFLRGKERLVMLPSRSVTAEDARMINLVLDAARTECQKLVWGAISNGQIPGDVAIGGDLLAVVAEVGLSAALDRFTGGLDAMPENDTGVEFSPELLALENGKFCILDGKSLVVNVEGFSVDARENFRREILNLEISGVVGGVNERGVFISPTIIGKYFYFDLNESACVDANLLEQIRCLIETELFLFDAWEHAVV